MSNVNADMFEGKRKRSRGRVNQVREDLADDALAKIDGRCDRFVGVLQEKYGFGKEEAQRQIDSEFAAGA